MARKLRLTEDDIQSALLKFEDDLRKTKTRDGKISLSFKLTCENKKAQLWFTNQAWTKMFALVDAFESEVQWHGLVSRVMDNMFLIEDILLFPHEASSATVTSDQKEYEEWQDSLSDKEFNKCRFHGHSHVRMDVSPSPVDTRYRSDILNNFAEPDDDEDQFYVFLITNKRREFNVEIYDLTNNILYETTDINYDVLVKDDLSLSAFVKEAKELVTIPATKYTKPCNSHYPPQNGTDPRKFTDVKKNSLSPSGAANPMGTSMATTTTSPSHKHKHDDWDDYINPETGLPWWYEE